MPGKLWTADEEVKLKEMVDAGEPLGLMASVLGRSKGAVREKCSRLGLRVVVSRGRQRTTSTMQLPEELPSVEDTPDYLARLSKKIDYSAGSIKSQFLPDLLSAGLIESLNPDKQGPPYKVTVKGKEILGPIFLVRTIGYYVLILTIVAHSALLFFYVHNPLLLLQYCFPSTLIGFSAIIIVLILYPQIILKFGKKAF